MYLNWTNRLGLSVIAIMILGAIYANAQDKIPEYTIEQFLKTTSYSGASFSHDNSKLLVSNDSTGVFNAYSIDIATGKASALTSSDKDSIMALSFFRRTIVFYTLPIRAETN